MRQRGITLVDVVVVVEVILVGFLLLAAALWPAVHHGHGRANQSKCGNNLKQIGMAAIQYSDDKRFFPHLGKINDLDPGWKSNTATRACRALVFYNYNDNPESFICPNSQDSYYPITENVRKDIRAFRWQGTDGPVTTVSPMVAGGEDAKDLPLDKALDLSYGWTRKGLTTNSPSTRLVAGDKAMIVESEDASHKENMYGNHKDCMITVCVDAHTIRVSPNGESLNTRTISRAESNDDGFLGVLGDDPSLGQ